MCVKEYRSCVIRLLWSLLRKINRHCWALQLLKVCFSHFLSLLLLCVIIHRQFSFFPRRFIIIDRLHTSLITTHQGLSLSSLLILWVFLFHPRFIFRSLAFFPSKRLLAIKACCHPAFLFLAVFVIINQVNLTFQLASCFEYLFLYQAL